MKRILVLVLVMALAFGAVAGAEAKKKKKRTTKVTRKMEAVYQLPGFGTATARVACSPDTGSCGRFVIGLGERFAKITLTDASGTPTAFGVRQDTEQDPTGTAVETDHGTFCGTTGDKPIKILPGYDLVIFIWAWGDVLCPNGFGSTGSITAEFSNLP